MGARVSRWQSPEYVDALRALDVAEQALREAVVVHAQETIPPVYASLVREAFEGMTMAHVVDSWTVAMALSLPAHLQELVTTYNKARAARMEALR